MSAPTRLDQLITAVPGEPWSVAATTCLSDAIHFGLLRHGEQLPSEARLAAQMGVSTATVREALANLRSHGLIETRRGRNGGSFVCDAAAIGAGRERRLLHQRSLLEIRDFGDEFSAIAGASAELAARRAAPNQIARMRAAIERLAAAGQVMERMRAHGHLFIALAVASQSERLTRSMYRLQIEAMDLMRAPTDVDLVSNEQIVEAVTPIVDAIEAEDPQAAWQLAEWHVEQTMRWGIEQRLLYMDGEE